MKITLFIYCTLAFYLFLNEANAQISVTKKQVNNSDSILRLAIVSDRTGGMEADIFDNAIDKLNLMQS